MSKNYFRIEIFQLQVNLSQKNVGMPSVVREIDRKRASENISRNIIGTRILEQRGSCIY